MENLILTSLFFVIKYDYFNFYVTKIRIFTIFRGGIDKLIYTDYNANIEHDMINFFEGRDPRFRLSK